METEKITQGSRVVHEKLGFGRVMSLTDPNPLGHRQANIKLDNGEVLINVPVDNWELAFVFDGIIFDIENATLDELKAMLTRVREIRVAEPGKASKTIERKKKETMGTLTQGLSEETLAILKAGGVI